MVLLRFYWVVLGFTGFGLVLLSFTRFYLGFIGFHQVSVYITGFYRVLPSFTRFDGPFFVHVSGRPYCRARRLIVLRGSFALLFMIVIHFFGKKKQ